MKAAIVALLAIVSIACVSKAPAELAALTLPDLSRAEPSVQQQINDSYREVESKKNDAAAHGELGKILLAAEYLEAAETCFLNAQRLAPADARWPYYLGHLYKTRGETEKSVAAFQRARDLQPDDVATLVWLGRELVDADHAEAADGPLQRALALQPRSAAAYGALGRAALARRDYATAVTDLEHALELSPQASAIEYPLGLAYRGLGRTEQAEAHLKRRGDRDAVPVDPRMDELGAVLRSAVAYETRGVRALDAGDYAGAVSAFRQGVAIAPDNASLRHELATALLLAGDPQEALEQFTEITRRTPSFAKAYYSLGLLLESQGRFDEAADRFAGAVKADANYPGAELQLAEVLRRSGRASESLPHYMRVISLDPRVADARVGYAMALAHLKRYREARDELVEATRTQPDSPAPAQALARLLAAAPDDRVRDPRRAIDIVQRLLKKPHEVDLYEAMAMTLAELGQYDQAVQWQRGAMAAADKAGHADLAGRLAENLKLFENHMPCRTPWRDDESAVALER